MATRGQPISRFWISSFFKRSKASRCTIIGTIANTSRKCSFLYGGMINSISRSMFSSITCYLKMALDAQVATVWHRFVNLGIEPSWQRKKFSTVHLRINKINCRYHIRHQRISNCYLVIVIKQYFCIAQEAQNR